MATIKSFSDLQQSKKLTEILLLESADMCFNTYKNNMPPLMVPYSRFTEFFNMEPTPAFLIPCWSLAALLEQIPYEICDDDGNSLYLEINKEDDIYQLAYIDSYGFTENIYPDMHEHFVDACYDMIIKLHELKML